MHCYGLVDQDPSIEVSLCELTAGAMLMQADS